MFVFIKSWFWFWCWFLVGWLVLVLYFLFLLSYLCFLKTWICLEGEKPSNQRRDHSVVSYEHPSKSLFIFTFVVACHEGRQRFIPVLLSFRKMCCLYFFQEEKVKQWNFILIPLRFKLLWINWKSVTNVEEFVFFFLVIFNVKSMTLDCVHWMLLTGCAVPAVERMREYYC